MSVIKPSLLFFVIGLLAASVTVIPTEAATSMPVEVGIAAPPAHTAYISAQEFAKRAEEAGVSVTVVPNVTNALEATHALAVIPIADLAQAVPALTALELPFLFPDMRALHRALDGGLGKQLRVHARAAGWEILAFWDEGARVLSGNRRYSDPLNLTGMEFVTVGNDTLAERQFSAWDAWARPTGAKTQGQLHAECLVGSREATLQQLQAEDIQRVHLDLSLTEHRYDGWVLVARTPAWSQLDRSTRTRLAAVLSSLQGWQRQAAAEREQRALDALVTGGMHVHRLSAAQRAAFHCRLPAALGLLSPPLSTAQAQKLLDLAQTAQSQQGRHTLQPACNTPKGENGDQDRATKLP